VDVLSGGAGWRETLRKMHDERNRKISDCVSVPMGRAHVTVGGHCALRASFKFDFVLSASIIIIDDLKFSKS
jgi:hypothetical protein